MLELKLNPIDMSDGGCFDCVYMYVGVCTVANVIKIVELEQKAPR